MADVVSREVRSRMMSGIRGKNTRPEIALRRALHARGLRYRIHVKDLPGKPDIVLPRHRAAVFVNGCFWHGHDCDLFRWPESREEFWRTKITRNRELDARNTALLLDAGWRVLTVWECCLKGTGKVGIEELVDSVVEWIRSDVASAVIRGRRGANGQSRPDHSRNAGKGNPARIRKGAGGE